MSRLQGRLETDRYGGGAIVEGETLATAHEFIAAEIVGANLGQEQRIIRVEVMFPENKKEPVVHITLHEGLETVIEYDQEYMDEV